MSRETDPLWSQVLATIRRYDMLEGAGPTGMGVVVGASGGPDSTALVHTLAHLAPQLGLTPHVAHLNHGFRGEEAAADAEYARGLAAGLGLGFTADFADVPAMARRTGVSAPAAAREARYAFFRAVAAAVGATCVAVGHTLDDQTETILMRLARGAGVEGLSGIPAVRDDQEVRIIRPLIRTRRAEVEAYCARHGLAPRRDSSNEKPLYLRNRLRLEVMPVLHRLEPAFSGNAARTAEILAAENEVMSAAAQAAFRRAATGDGAADDRAVRLSRQEFLALPTALQRRVVRLAYGRAGRDPEELDFEHVESARLAAAGPSGRRIGLGRGVEMSTEHACLVFRIVHTNMHTRTHTPAPASPTPAPAAGWARTLVIPGVTDVPELGLSIVAEVIEEHGGAGVLAGLNVAAQAAVDYNVVAAPLLVRTRRSGDCFRPYGMPGTKKLADFLVDEHVPRERRDRVPVIVTAGGDLVWIGGFRIADGYRITPSTARVLLFTILPGETWETREGRP